MSDDPQKTPRRRRSRRTGKRSGRSSGNVETTSPQPRPERSSQQRRRSPRSQASEGDTSRSPQLVVHKEDRSSLEVSRLNRDIFIYTYTLFPRSYLDSYQTGPGVAERMEYED